MMLRTLDYEFVHEFVDGCRLEPDLIEAKLQDRTLLPGREAPCQMSFELRFHQRNAFGATARMTNRILNLDLRRT